MGSHSKKARQEVGQPITREHDPSIRNIPGAYRIAGGQHSHIGDFAAITVLALWCSA
jgi:hypothetical protein